MEIETHYLFDFLGYPSGFAMNVPFWWFINITGLGLKMKVPAPAESTAKPQVGSDRDLITVHLETVVFFLFWGL